MSADQPSLQESLHVAASIDDAVNDNVAAYAAMDHAPGFAVQLPIFCNADTCELFRNISTGRELCEIGTCAFDFRQDTLSRLDAIRDQRAPAERNPGHFWEITAVPDIRVQAKAVVEEIVRARPN